VVRRRLENTVIVLLVLISSSCELKEVTVATGEKQLVVQAVMRPDLDSQSVFVEYSLTGEMNQTDDNGDPFIPVQDAMVRIINDSRTGNGCDVQIQLVPDVSVPGMYGTPSRCFLIQPGDSLSIEVTTPRNERVTGTMEVPGYSFLNTFVNRITFANSPPSGNPEFFSFNRDIDTLRFQAKPLFGRALDVEVQSFVGSATDFGIDFLVDTLRFEMPGTFVDFNELDPGDESVPVFRPGRLTTVSTSLVDQNMFDFLRSFNDPFTGRGFVNKLEGGIGVFGGEDPRVARLRVVANQDDSREGDYSATGTVSGEAANFMLELYLVG